MTDVPHEFGFILTLGTNISVPITKRTNHVFKAGTPAIVLMAGRDRRGVVWYDVVFDGFKTILRVYANSKHTIEKVSWPSQEVPEDGKETNGQQ